MTVTINLPRKLEGRLRERAAKRGVATADYVLLALESDLLRVQEEGPPKLAPDKSRLLNDFNAGLAPEIWQRYHKLSRKRRANTLTTKEHRELIKLSDLVEEANVRRLQLVLDYANANGKRFEDVVKEFKIGELANV